VTVSTAAGSPQAEGGAGAGAGVSDPVPPRLVLG